MAIRMLGVVHLSRPRLVWEVDRSFPLTLMVRGDADAVVGSNGTQLTISSANLCRLAHSLARLWVLSSANCDAKAMPTRDSIEEQLASLSSMYASVPPTCKKGIPTPSPPKGPQAKGEEGLGE